MFTIRTMSPLSPMNTTSITSMNRTVKDTVHSPGKILILCSFVNHKLNIAFEFYINKMTWHLF